jgi:metal-responsive CopG/Arc/MetJ family transcriptional regulator
MKTAISIPDQLFRAVELAAERLGISRSEVFQRAVREYLRNHRDKGVTKALNDVYGQTAIKSTLDPFLERLQIASLPEDEW